jgi:hypothetical protein
MSTPRQNQSKHLSERFHDSTGKINVRFRFTSQELINLMVFKKQFLRNNIMEQSPAPEADSYSDTLEIHGILWNLKVNWCIYNNITLGAVRSQINPMHAFPYSFLWFILIFSHIYIYICQSLLSGFFHSGFPAKICTHFSSPPCALYTPPISASLIWPSY